LNYRSRGIERRLTIGSHPDWKVAAAREEAKRLKRLIDQGRDPMAERHEERAAPTVKDLAERYLLEHASKKRERGRIEDQSLVNQWVVPELGSLKVADVEFKYIDRLHRKITRGGKDRKPTPVRANRTLALLSTMFNLAIRWKMRSDNPCKGVGRNYEDQRERYLDEDEIERLMKALDAHPNQRAADVIRLLLYTGARRGEVMRATWSQFVGLDTDKAVWIKPSSHTKTEKLHRVPLAEPAREFLLAMRNKADAEVAEYNAKRTVGQPKRDRSRYLFPGHGTDGPIVDIKKSWAAIAAAAQIKDVRIHDLRHSVASILINKGLSLPVIGQLLGHTQSQTTKRYAHLADRSLREAAEHVAKVVTLRKAERA
jgi:integrase